MKIKLVIMSLSFLMGISSAFAENKITVGVKGMVCGFCAQGIEKKFKAESSVEKIDVSLEKKTVTLTTKDGQNINDVKIKNILVDSGYTVEKIERE
jgi:mercuric ion binding protein